MQLFSRFAVILGVIWLCLYALAPTYRWYTGLNPDQKALANTSKKDFRALTQQIESNVQIVRAALGSDPTNYRLALSEEDRAKKQYVVDLSDDRRIFLASLPYEKLQNVVMSINPSYKEYASLRKAYEALQGELASLAEIARYQHIKNNVIKMGLDIAGGVHFSLGIDEEKMNLLLDEQYSKLISPVNIQKNLLAKNPKLSGSDLTRQVQVREKELQEEKQEKLNFQKEEGIDQALTKIRNRIDQFGVSEPVILKGPNSTIIVELPGEKDVESTKEVFTRVGVLSFQIVNEDFMKTVNLDNRSFSGYILDPSKASHLPENSQFLPVQGIDRFDQPINEGYLAVYKNIELDGSRLTSAQVENNSLGQRTIAFRLDSTGAEIFANVTRNNVGKRLAIILDSKIQSAPNIREAIVGGSGSISGAFTLKEANLLSTILRSGSLPVPLKIEEQKVIGPSLGLEETRKGIRATLIALALVMIFAFVYYGFWGGLSTNMAQILNILIILAVMAQLGATLTLPGLAAIVLTIGMSVDANIIIHERIKEDLRNGFTLPSALKSGYHSAFTTILDSNTTTFIPGLILGSIGDGPIRGFGIVLMIGLIVNLFTAVFCTRAFYDLVIEYFKIKHIFWSRFHAKS